MSRVGSGPGNKFKNLRPDRIGSRSLEISRVGLGEEVLKSRGSGQVMTREIRVTRGSSHHEPRVVFD